VSVMRVRGEGCVNSVCVSVRDVAIVRVCVNVHT